MRQQKDWTKIIPLFAIGGIVGMLVLGSLSDIFEGTGAADTTRGAGRAASSAARGAGGYASNAGSSAGDMFENVMAYGIITVIVVIAAIGLWILFKVIGWVSRRGGSSGRTALRRAERDEQQALDNARNDGQQAVHQARVEAQQRSDDAIRTAQQRVTTEQDRWV